MKILCVSDIHGNLPPIESLPSADVLVIAGDICPVFDHDIYFQQQWLGTNFRSWLFDVQKIIPKIVFIAGNHDFFFEKYDHEAFNSSWTNDDHPMRGNKGIYYLQDSGVTINGVAFWGTPWQRRFYDWAFNLDEQDLAAKWDLIPSKTDVIICHGPAYGYGDLVPKSGNPRSEQAQEDPHVGSKAMLKRIEEIRPKAYICGHIHCGYGICQTKSGTLMVNASYVNHKYVPTNSPILIEI